MALSRLEAERASNIAENRAANMGGPEAKRARLDARLREKEHADHD